MPGHPPTPMPASAHNARGKRRARTAAAATSGASWSGNVLEMRRSKKSLTRPQKKKTQALDKSFEISFCSPCNLAALVGTDTLPGSVAPANRPAGGLAGRGFARSGNGGQKAARECLDTCVPSGSCGAAACRKAWFGCGSTISSPTSALQSTAAFTTGPVRPALASALTRHHSAYASLPMPDAKQTTVLPWCSARGGCKRRASQRCRHGCARDLSR